MGSGRRKRDSGLCLQIFHTTNAIPHVLSVDRDLYFDGIRSVRVLLAKMEIDGKLCATLCPNIFGDEFSVIVPCFMVVVVSPLAARFAIHRNPD